MPRFALFTTGKTDKFKEKLPVQCTSSGRRVQSSRKRQENGIMEEHTEEVCGEGSEGSSFAKEMMEAPERPYSDDEL